MEKIKILDINSTKLQKYLLNPKSGDKYTCEFPTHEGRKICTITVGRKWVTLRWKEIVGWTPKVYRNRSKRLSLKLFCNHAFIYWRYLARQDACSKAMVETGRYKRPKGWWKDYGFKSNPEDKIITGVAYKF